VVEGPEGGEGKKKRGERYASDARVLVVKNPGCLGEVEVLRESFSCVTVGIPLKSYDQV